MYSFKINFSLHSKKLDIQTSDWRWNGQRIPAAWSSHPRLLKSIMKREDDGNERGETLCSAINLLNLCNSFDFFPINKYNF
jgi:hypothetical protein